MMDEKENALNTLLNSGTKEKIYKYEHIGYVIYSQQVAHGKLFTMLDKEFDVNCRRLWANSGYCEALSAKRI
jgi:hypothetical protein